ncbi:MAG TPA: CvpA family protein [Myxococcaceae bacterium]|nr:CvpA family protein [Myxococcaceae bacterium]
MILDLFILSLVAVFAVVGGFTGASRQIAQVVALGVGYLCARPLGAAFGPRLASALHLPMILGVIAAMLVLFILVMACVRLLLTRLLRRILAGDDERSRGLDRALGFGLGGFKVLLIAYFILSALSFVEDNVSLAGRRLGLSPKDSISFSLARKYNLFEMVQYRPVKDLVGIAEALHDPARAERLRKDPAFRALNQDPRFQRSLADRAMQEAIETGDYRALLQRDDVVRLIQTPAIAARLRAAAEASR